MAAHHGEPSVREAALAVMRDSNRVFIASPFLRLETIPHSERNKNASEIEFYSTYFDHIVRIVVSDFDLMIKIAHDVIRKWPLGAMDALHVSAAYIGEAEILFTTEGKQKPIHLVSLVKVVFVEPYGD